MEQECVLIVEADVLVRQQLSEYLRDCGYRVVGAANTDEAKTVLTNNIPVDVVLADIDSRGNVDGFGLTRWIKQQGLPTKIILAGAVSKAVQEAGELCDEGPLLKKPYDTQLLLDRIKSVLAERERKGGSAAAEDT